MNNRLLDIIKYKTGGRQSKFAELLGWTPQYLAKLLRGDNFGLQPVLTLLEKLPEINARWLLLGDGEMLSDAKRHELCSLTTRLVSRFMNLERYMPVMSPDEIHEFECALIGGFTPDFGDEQVRRWEALLAERNSKIDDAIAKSVIPCKRPKAKQ